MSTLIFEKSREGRRAFAQAPVDTPEIDLPEHFLRQDRPRLPEASELQVVRHSPRL
jgi:glycine dehydrogenase subunit 2